MNNIIPIVGKTLRPPLLIIRDRVLYRIAVHPFNHMPVIVTFRFVAPVVGESTKYDIRIEGLDGDFISCIDINNTFVRLEGVLYSYHDVIKNQIIGLIDGCYGGFEGVIRDYPRDEAVVAL